MDRKQTNEEFARLAWLMRDHIIIRIQSSRVALDSMHLFTSVKRKSGLVQSGKNLVVWVTYTCGFLDEVRNHKEHRYHLSLVDADANSGIRSKKEILSLVGSSEIDISHKYADIDGGESIKNRLYLIHLVHLARLQGMLLTSSGFYTNYDAEPHLAIAKRLGGVINKHAQNINDSVQLLKNLV